MDEILEIKDRLKSKIDFVRNTNGILLSKMATPHEMDVIYKRFERDNTLRILTIGREYYFIRQVFKNTQNIDFSALEDIALDEYEKGNYNSCIKIAHTIISFQDHMDDRLLALIAKCYKENNQIQRALNYYLMAGEVSKLNGKEYRYVPEKKECRAILDEKNKEIELPNNVTYAKIELLIVDVIDCNEDLDCALNNYGFNEQDKLVATLKLAKEYYRRNCVKQGDKLLKKVEQAPVKCEKVKNDLNYIRSNKKIMISKFAK